MGGIQHDETLVKTTQYEDCEPYMDDILDRDTFGEENDAKRGRSPSTRRRSSTQARESMPERKFNEII